jgi:hypothetical protein
MWRGLFSRTHLSIGGLASVAACMVLGNANHARANVVVSLDPTQAWIGYMNVFDNPVYSGDSNYQFGSSWGTASLDAAFSGNVATIGPNTSLDPASGTGDPSTYWWLSSDPTSPGVKNMDANFYVQNDALAGSTVEFTGDVLSNTLVSPYATTIFIKDYNASYAVVGQNVINASPGIFDITLATNPGDHIQYGFETDGPNARVAAAPALGDVVVTVVPEPVSIGAMAMVTLPLLTRRRRRV